MSCRCGCGWRCWGAAALSPLRAADIVRRSLQPERPEVFRAFAHDYRQAQGQLRLFSVSTGTPPATYNLVLARMLRARPIVNMTPSLLPRRLFELNIVPGARCGGRDSLPRRTSSRRRWRWAITTARRRRPWPRGWRANKASMNTDSYLGVCIGGPTPDIPYPAGWCERSAAPAAQRSGAPGLRLLITTSRRTPERDTAAIAAAVAGNPQCAYFLDAHADPLNPLPAFYELSRAMVITADSYSMVSESIHAGHQPLVLVPPHAKRDAKVHAARCSGSRQKDMLRLSTDAARLPLTPAAAQIAAIAPRGQANATVRAAAQAQVRWLISSCRLARLARDGDAAQDAGDHGVDVAAFELALRRQQQAVAQHGRGQRLHLVRRDVALGADRRQRLAAAQQRDPRARAGAQRDGCGACASRARWRGCSPARPVPRARRRSRGGSSASAPATSTGVTRRPRQVVRVEAAVVALEHLALFRLGGIVDVHLEQEAVELRLGQRIRALIFHGVLRGEDGEIRAAAYASRRRR